MRNRANKVLRKLSYEQLESRTMLAATSGVLSGGGFPADSSAAAVPALFGPATPGRPAALAVPAPAVNVASISALSVNPNSLLGFDATSGNGQITLTTGANTPGISSFAWSTNGISFQS